MDEREILKKTEMDLKGLVVNDEMEQVVESNTDVYLLVYNHVLKQSGNSDFARMVARDVLRASLPRN